MPNEMTISAIIITYKRADELAGALENIFAQELMPDEVIIIDNDPAGSGRAVIPADNDRIKYICSGENLGPAAGRNLAAEHALGDILLYLDDDGRFEGNNATRIVHDSFARDSAMAFLTFTIRNAFTKEIQSYEYPGYSTANWDKPHNVSYFIGSGFAIRRDVFEQIGGFDEVLFYCEEEVELSFRLLNAGWTMQYIPNIVILHRTSPKGREQLRRSYRLIRNRLYLALKNLPWLFVITHYVLWGGFAFIQAFRGRELGQFMLGIKSLWTDKLWQRAWEYRRAHPMTWRAVKYMWQNEGRLWY